MKLCPLVVTALFAGTFALAETPAPTPDEAAAKEQKTASLAALKTLKVGLEDRAALVESLALARKAVRRVRGLAWDREDRPAWADAAMQVVKTALEEGRTAKSATPPDWTTAALSLKVASAVAAGLSPEEFPQEEMQALERDKNEAVDQWYFGDNPPAGAGPKDMLADTWKWRSDSEIRITRNADRWVIENTDPAGRAAFAGLENRVEWTDYRIRMEFTPDEGGFVLFQRQHDEVPPAVQHDALLLMQTRQIQAGAPCKLDFWVYGNRFRIANDKAVGKPGRCSPSGASSGGFSFRLPPGGKLIIRKLEVTVFEQEE